MNIRQTTFHLIMDALGMHGCFQPRILREPTQEPQDKDRAHKEARERGGRKTTKNPNKPKSPKQRQKHQKSPRTVPRAFTRGTREKEGEPKQRPNKIYFRTTRREQSLYCRKPLDIPMVNGLPSASLVSWSENFWRTILFFLFLFVYVIQ